MLFRGHHIFSYMSDHVYARPIDNIRMGSLLGALALLAKKGVCQILH